MCNFKFSESTFRSSTCVVSRRGGSRAWELEAEELSDKVQGQPVLCRKFQASQGCFEKCVLCCVLKNVCLRMCI